MFARSPPRTAQKQKQQQPQEMEETLVSMPTAATLDAASASSSSSSSSVVAPAPSSARRLHVFLEVARTPKSLSACNERSFESKLLQWITAQRQGGARFSAGTLPVPPQLEPHILSLRCEITREPEGDADLDDDDSDSDDAAEGDQDASERKEEEEEELLELDEPEIVGLGQAASVAFAVYTLLDNEPQVEEIQLAGDDPSNADDAQSVSAGLVYDLPHRSMDALWCNLFYPASLKSKVLAHAAAAQMAVSIGYDADVIGCNRLVLLHGPPGTGKTTFCKAIAHKLAIRARRKLVHFHAASGAAEIAVSPASSSGSAARPPPECRFLDLNSHSLFSKFFSESGKLVHALFDSIVDALQADPQLRYFILVDEVESLAAQRGLGASDPQDAVRAGNAVLNELDRLRSYPNVLVLCTSNLTAMIDTAFGDRADIRQYIGPPSREARYEILASQVQEILRVGSSSSSSAQDPTSVQTAAAPIYNDVPGLGLKLLSYRQLKRAEAAMDAAAASAARSAASSTAAAAAAAAATVALPGVSPEFVVSLQLAIVAASCPAGVGGRLLRRAPVRALADWNAARPGVPMPLSRYIARLGATLRREIKDAQQMSNSKHTPTAATTTPKIAAPSSSSSSAAAAAAAAPMDSDTTMN